MHHNRVKKSFDKLVIKNDAFLNGIPFVSNGIVECVNEFGFGQLFLKHPYEEIVPRMLIDKVNDVRIYFNGHLNYFI